MHRENSVFGGPIYWKRLDLLFAALIAFQTGLAAQSGVPRPATDFTPLAVNAIVDNLVHRDLERAQSLQSAEATRIYRLVYTGFPGDCEAEMTVRALYSSPSQKDFEVLSRRGCKVILDRVFRRLLEDEKEAASPEVRDRIALNRDNYDFRLLGFERSDHDWQYVLQVTPKSKNKYVYRGRVWVDASDFAVTHIDAEPAQSPSFWTKRSEFHHQYTRIQGFWVPAHNESVSYVRMGGRAVLTIDYSDYHLNRTANRPARSSIQAFSPQPPALLISPR